MMAAGRRLGLSKLLQVHWPWGFNCREQMQQQGTQRALLQSVLQCMSAWISVKTGTVPWSEYTGT